MNVSILACSTLLIEVHIITKYKKILYPSSAILIGFSYFHYFLSFHNSQKNNELNNEFI